GLQRDRGGARVDQVADGAPGRLLGANALANFAGAPVEHVNRDPGFPGKEIAQHAHRAKRGAVVDDDLAFLLGGGGGGGGWGRGKGKRPPTTLPPSLSVPAPLPAQ